ncbi:MAG: hypothetical protein IPJ77_23595 [Planctomycetes bacterium]|nr:hypothetical protein [Planctomycetota bacterium]
MSRVWTIPALAFVVLATPSFAQQAIPASAPALATVEPTKVLQPTVTTTRIAKPIADGALIAAVEDAGTDIQILDAATLTAKYTLKGHTGKVTSISASMDGKRLASASEDKTVRLWDLATGKEIAKRMHATPVPAVTMLGDDKVASATGATVEVWSASAPDAKPSVTFTAHKGTVTNLAASRDGKHIVSAGPDIVVCYWGGDGQLITSFSSHTDAVTGLGIDDLGMKAVSSGKDGKVVVYDLAQKKEHAKYSGFAGAATSASLSPDGKKVVAASAEKVLCLDAATLKEMYALAPFRTKALCASFSKDGTKIIAAGDLDPAVTDAAKKGSIKIYPAR